MCDEAAQAEELLAQATAAGFSGNALEVLKRELESKQLARDSVEKPPPRVGPLQRAADRAKKEREDMEAEVEAEARAKAVARGKCASQEAQLAAMTDADEEVLNTRDSLES